MKNANTNRKYHVKGFQFSSLRAAIEMGLSYAVPPVIFFTAKSRVEDMVEGMEAGAYKYLVKPTSREKLLETVRAALTDLYPNRS